MSAADGTAWATGRRTLDRPPQSARPARRATPPLRQQRPDDPRRLRLEALRDAVRAAQAACASSNVGLLEGPDLLPDWPGITTDLAHPSDYGMSVMGERVAAKLRSILSVDHGQ